MTKLGTIDIEIIKVLILVDHEFSFIFKGKARSITYSR